MRNIKRITNKATVFSVIAAIIAALILGSFSLAVTNTRAHAEDTADYNPTSLGISNPDFNQTSGSFPKTPSSWTGAHIGDGESDIVAGVVDLKAKTYLGDGSGNEKFKLDQYDEYASEDKIPGTIFGDNSNYKDTDSTALFINTAKGASAAYAYSSSDMTFAANSFYRVSVWVKTGNFASDTGATVKLTGLDKPCEFININTVANLSSYEEYNKPDNDYDWVKYTMYVSTPVAGSNTVKLSLGLGGAVTGEEEDPVSLPRPASGYAFFDTVKAERISPEDFEHETRDFIYDETNGVYYNGTRTSLALDMFDADYLTAQKADASTVEIGTFSDDTDLWNMNATYDEDAEDFTYVGNARTFIYDAGGNVDIDDNVYGFTQNPRTPLGIAENGDKAAEKRLPVLAGSNNNILVISSYNEGKKTFDKAAYGVASPTVTIERYKYYRMGVWVKGDGIDGGNGISIGVKGQANDTANDNKLNKWFTGLAGDTEDTAHYGWKEQTVYIKGSTISDLDVHFELWMGAPDALTSGIAMFDNVTFTEISYDYYTDHSSDGNVLTLDAAATETGVTNGNFMNIGEHEEIKFPLPAADWTYITPDKTETKGFSYAEVNTDSAVYGIIPSGDAFDELNEAKLASVTNPAHFADGAAIYNALFLSSDEQTAFCYRSSNITVTKDKGYKLTVSLAVNNMKDGDYGASLVLRSAAGSVLSTIEGITDTANAFKTYTFYIDAPLSDSTVNLEIWLGLNDRVNNTKKLSAGNVYVKQVSMTEWTVGEDSTVAAEYKTQLDKYLSDIQNPTVVKNLDYGMYSFSAPILDYYDIYSYNGGEGLAVPYAWTVNADQPQNSIYGIFNSENMHGIQIPDFDKKDLSGNMLMIQNTLPNKTELAYDNTLALAANTYYRLDVTLNVRMPEAARNNNNVKGATIALTGTRSDSFDNIKDTSKLIAPSDETSRDYGAFATYTFYFSSGSDGGNVGLKITFGGNDKSSYAEGRVIIADIAFTSINNTTFENAEKAGDSATVKTIRLSETTETDDTDTEAPQNEVAWWIIPTIIFSAALIIAIIIIIVFRVRDRIKKKQKATYTSEYDRSAAAKKLEALERGESTSTDSKPDDSLSDDFDDSAAPAPKADEPIDDTAESPAEPTETAEEPEAEAEEPPADADTDASKTEQAPSTDLDD